MDREEQNRLILAELARLYPDARPALHFANPFELLVAVMLSAQCTDVKVNMVTPALFAAYPDAAALAKAEPAEIEPIIKTCGLFHNKAKNLVLMARELTARFGGEVPADHDALESLPGVGRKTANVVMSCAFGADAIAVDTHVFRVANRLGAGRCARRAQNRASAHAKHPAEPMEPRAPLADLSRPPRVRRPKACLRKLHPARMVRICQRQSKRQKISGLKPPRAVESKDIRFI